MARHNKRNSIFIVLQLHSTHKETALQETGSQAGVEFGMSQVKHDAICGNPPLHPNSRNPRSIEKCVLRNPCFMLQQTNGRT